ncbi:MAG: hypothetical protein CMN01_05950 [Rickettsiales bacterium]|nr:hypothetical protein [Rickettsiales bacterium]|tara:strand:+ start:413 stop:844 length:432 start_codon:yes stop_codon:yes gene_type:complete
MKKSLFNSSIGLIFLLLTISCSNKEKSVECSTFLECLDGTYWTTNNNQSIWTFNDNINGEYLELYISGFNCYTYENNFIVNAQFKYQTKINLSEEFGGSNWLYTIVNDSIIEKSKSTGGNTSFFYKTDKSFLDELLEFDECNN